MEAKSDIGAEAVLNRKFVVMIWISIFPIDSHWSDAIEAGQNSLSFQTIAAISNGE
jgi:hypothetical protein